MFFIIINYLLIYISCRNLVFMKRNEKKNSWHHLWGRDGKFDHGQCDLEMVIKGPKWNIFTVLMYKMTVICCQRLREHAKLTNWLFLSYYYSQCPLLKLQFRARTFVFILVDPCLPISTTKFWKKSAAAIETSERSGSPQHGSSVS